ncbi:MBL fold metallo-hydrolase [SAR202 cluster bacterium AD-804-J14_MRT_500m]|nr:MBL fold metallo-hydrolase [SAR202 cluster bacterium AD-804-J14_MRT_500m]
MEITWLAHSCFRLRIGDVTVITDPFPQQIGTKIGKIEPNIVTISNDHPNHSTTEGIPDGYKIVNGPGEYAISSIYIRGLLTSQSGGENPEPKNTAYLFEMDSVHLCHLGDLSSGLSDAQVEELTPVDVLFIPVGGRCTIPISKVSEIIRDLGPRLIIPMHYSTPGINVDLEKLDPFLKELSAKAGDPQPRINVTATNLPMEPTVTLLRPTRARDSDVNNRPE